jgi:CheY-like chemotaxis protein
VLSEFKPVVLWAEDSTNDAVLVDDALKELRAEGLWIRVRNAAEGIAYLRGEGMFRDRRIHPLPHVIVTDMKMPGMWGAEFIRALRSIPCLDKIPAFVLTESDFQHDRDAALDAGAVGYFRKPSDGMQWEQSLRKVLTAIGTTLEFLSAKKSIGSASA